MDQRPCLFALPLVCLLLLAASAVGGWVDGTLPPAWFYESEQASADLGYAVSGVGDLNGDGYEDVVIGAIKYAQNSVKGGAVFLFYGRPGGLYSGPDWSFATDMNGAELGTAVAGAGDVNGDGFADLIVTAPGCSHPESKEGCLFLFYGAATGLSSEPDQILELNQRDAYLGTAVAGAGDVDGDGYDDVIVGAKWYTAAHTNEGAAFLFLGGVAGLSETPVWQFLGGQNGASLGTAVAGVGDLDGDGYDDVLIGAPFFDAPAADSVLEDAGYVALFSGSAAGLSLLPTWEQTGAHAEARFGMAVAPAGDVNNDGLPDLMIGAPGWPDQAGQPGGAAFVYAGTPDWSSATLVWTAVSSQAHAQFGTAVGSAGDMNNDGYADVVVGAPQYSRDQSQEGAIFVYLGSPLGLAADYWWIAEGDKAETMFGFAVAPAGDVSQDGYADILVGAPEYRSQTELRGRAFLFQGQPAINPTHTLFLPTIFRS